MAVEKVQEELREAEKQLLAGEETKRAIEGILSYLSSYIYMCGNGFRHISFVFFPVDRPPVTIDSRRLELQEMAENHAKRISASNALRLSAENDIAQIENGGYFQSKMYNTKPQTIQSAGGDRDGNHPAINYSRDVVDSLTSEIGLHQQEQKIKDLQNKSPEWHKHSLNDFQTSIEPGRKNDGSSNNNQRISAEEFLEKWLKGDDKVDSLLSKQSRPSHVIPSDKEELKKSEQILAMKHETPPRNRTSDETSVASKSSRVSEEESNPPKRHDMSSTSSSKTIDAEASKVPPLRTRSAGQGKMPSSASSSLSRARKDRDRAQEKERDMGRTKRHDTDFDSEVESDEYVYQEKFDARRPRLRQHGNGQPRKEAPTDNGNGNDHYSHHKAFDPTQPNPYSPNPPQYHHQLQQPPPYAYQNQFSMPNQYAPPPHSLQYFQQMPYSMPQMPQHPYMHPNPFNGQVQQPQPMPYNPPHAYLPQGQANVPNSNQSPANDQFFGEMDKLQKLIEIENERLMEKSSNAHNSQDKDDTASDGVQEQANSYHDGGQPGSFARDRPRRRNRAELKHHYEMEAIRHDMEKLRQVNALEELKAQLEREKQMKKAEIDHQMWLEDQKRVVQALKIKQTVLSEEQSFKEAESALKGGAQHNSPLRQTGNKDREHTNNEVQKKSSSNKKRPVDRAASLEQLKYVDKMFVSVDGIIITPQLMSGSQFRVGLSLFDGKTKKLVGRAHLSEWENWTVTTSSKKVQSPGLAWFLKDAITKNPPSKLFKSKNALKCNSASEAELSKDRSNFLKALVEVQTRETDSSPQSLGWLVFDLPLVSPAHGLPVVDRDLVRVGVGAWRMRGRKGIRDAFGGQKSSSNDSIDMWVLFRVNAPKEAIVDSYKRSYLKSEDLLLKHEPLDGPYSIHPSESKNTKFSSLKNAVNAMGAVNSFKSMLQSHSSIKPPTASSRVPSVKSSRSRASRVSSKHSVHSSASRAVEALSRVSSRSDSTMSDAVQTARSKEDESIASSGSDRSHSDGSVSSYSSSGSSSRSGSISSRSSNTGSTGSSRSSHDIDSDHSDNDEENHDKADPLSKYWTPGTPLGPCDCKYQRGDGVDIYIDSARFLPDNCTVSRVVVKLMTSEYEVIGEVHECLSHPTEGSNISPVYNFKIECRRDVFNVTLTALIRIDTVDSVSLDTAGVGYAAIKVFSSQNREQPTTAKQPNTYINTGLFQLPIHGGRLKKDKEMTEKCLASVGLPVVPCASILVRIYPAPKAPDGLLVLSRSDYPEADWIRMKVDIPPPKAYLDGEYDGSQCEPTSPVDITAFEAKAALPTKTVESACAEAVSAKPKSSRRDVHPRPENATHSELMQWLGKLLLPVNSVTAVIDYGLCVPYSFVGGMSVSVERLFRMPSTGLFGSNDILFKVIYSISPPGLLYKDPPLAEGTQFTNRIKPSSELYSPEYEDGPVIFNPTNIEQALCIVFDVRLLNMEFDKGKSDYKLKIDSNTGPKSKDKKYWTLFPCGTETVSKGGYTHLVSGVYQLPLFEGPVPPDVLSSVNPLRQVLDALSVRKSSIKLCESGASVLFKCLNPALEAILKHHHKNWEDSISTKYLDMILSAAQSGNSAFRTDNFVYSAGTAGSSKTIAKQFSKSADVKKMLKEVNKEFAEAFDLRYDE